jgi:RNA-binding protein PNO1
MENIEITDNIETGKNESQNSMDITNSINNIDVSNQLKSTILSSVLNSNSNNKIVKREYCKIIVPVNRMKPLKENWPTIVKVLVEHMKIQIKMNLKKKCIEIRTSDTTEDPCAIRKCEDFLKAFMCGFELQDAIAMLRLEDLYLETFLIKDVKANLHGDHLSRCIGRICGEKGKTKNAIENATRTRILIQDQKIHILGSNSNVQLARNSICSLILGAPQGKVYSKLRIIGKKINEI